MSGKNKTNFSSKLWRLLVRIYYFMSHVWGATLNFLIQKVETFVHLLSVQETEFFWSKNWNFCTFTSCEGNWIFLIQKMWTFLHLLPVKTIMIHLGRPGRTWDSWVAWGIFLPKEQTNIYFSFVGFIYSVDLLVWRHTFSCCMLFIKLKVSGSPIDQHITLIEKFNLTLASFNWESIQ